MAKIKAQFVGWGVDSAGEHHPVIDGETVFKMMDSYGVPLSVSCDVLRKHDTGFSVLGFIEAALASGNWKPVKIKAELVDACEVGPQEKILVAAWIDRLLES